MFYVKEFCISIGNRFMDKDRIIRHEISEIGKRLYEKGFSPGLSGNISARLDDKIYITPSGMNLGDVKDDDVVMMDISGNILEEKKPSSERIMHLEIYKKRPDISAIIHCHAPKSSAFAVAGVPLTAPILVENVFVLGPVPLAEYAMPSSQTLAENVSDLLKTHEAVIMANHGVAVVGKTLQDAFYKMDTLEYYAEVYLWSKLLGRTRELSSEDVNKIVELRMIHNK